MPFCTECGSPLNETQHFCEKCGKNIDTQPTVAAYAKPFFNLSNDMVIGACIVLVVGALAVIFELNSIYHNQTIDLLLAGVTPDHVKISLSEIGQTIALSASFAILGSYVLAIVSLHQFSPKARAILERKDKWARLGNGLLAGGAVLLTLSAQQLIEQFYGASHSLFINVLYLGMIAAGLIMLFCGALSLRWAYLKSLGVPAKV